MKKELLFTIDDFDVYDNTVYTVKDKTDYDAPSGYIENGVSRLPSDGVGDTFTCSFASIKPNSPDGLWDTGFYEDSRCYSAERDRSVVKSKVARVIKHVKKPYSTMIGGEDVLGQSKENTYWDEKLFEVYSGQVFNTAKADERFELYFALLTGHLTPEGQEGNSKFGKSTYIVLDINKGMKRKDEKALMKFEAISSFMSHLKTDKNRIIEVLDYIGMPVSDTVADSTMMSMFEGLITNDESKLKLYNQLIEESSTQDGRAKLAIYKALKTRFPNKGVTRSKNGVYFFQEEEIGGDLKTAASNIATQKLFKDIKNELILGDD